MSLRTAVVHAAGASLHPYNMPRNSSQIESNNMQIEQYLQTAVCIAAFASDVHCSSSICTALLFCIVKVAYLCDHTVQLTPGVEA